MKPESPTWYGNLWYTSDKELSRWLSETTEEAKMAESPDEHLALAFLVRPLLHLLTIIIELTLISYIIPHCSQTYA